jgi:membrane protein required for colicin V production
MLENTGNNLIAMLPDNPEGLLQQLRKREAPDADPAEPAEPDPQRGTNPAPAAPVPPRRG